MKNWLKHLKYLVWRFRIRKLLSPKYFIAGKGEVSEKDFLKWYNEQLKNF